jgi:hypothetical protein
MTLFQRHRSGLDTEGRSEENGHNLRVNADIKASSRGLFSGTMSALTLRYSSGKLT